MDKQQSDAAQPDVEPDKVVPIHLRIKSQRSAALDKALQSAVVVEMPNGDQRFRCTLCAKTYSARCAFGRHIDEGVCLRAQGKAPSKRKRVADAEEKADSTEPGSSSRPKRSKLPTEKQVSLDVKRLLRIVKSLVSSVGTSSLTMRSTALG